MLPFHKIYSAIFKSFDLKSETNTIKSLIHDGVSRVLIIKRSWIYALSLIWLPLFIFVIAIANIAIALVYHKELITQYSIVLGVGFSILFFIFSVWNYISHFRQIYKTPKVRTDYDMLLTELELGDKYFIRFFNQTLFNQLVLIVLIIWGGVSYLSFMKESWSMVIWVDILLLFLQWILLGRYRKRMMDLEMDYNIVIPGKIMFVNQSGMLSSVNTIEGDKVKTVGAKYGGWIGSFFNFGTIEIMTEGDNMSMTGTMPMYYVTAPNETGRLIQSMLNREATEEPLIPIAPTLPADNISSTQVPQETPEESVGEKIGPKEVTYDVKGIVRDVLR